MLFITCQNISLITVAKQRICIQLHVHYLAEFFHCHRPHIIGFCCKKKCTYIESLHAFGDQIRTCIIMYIVYLFVAMHIDYNVIYKSFTHRILVARFIFRTGVGCPFLKSHSECLYSTHVAPKITANLYWE